MIRLISFLFTLSFLLAHATAQEVLHRPFQQGDAALLSEYMPDEIDLCIINSEKRVTRDRAIKDLNAFFSTFKVNAYTPKHSGGSQNQGTSYVIGELNTSNGNFRTYIYYKTVGGKYQIEEIRIEN